MYTIDIESLLNRIKLECDFSRNPIKKMVCKTVISAINEGICSYAVFEESANDYVMVIRCRDCKFASDIGYCNRNNEPTVPYGFCHHARGKDYK